MLQQPLVDALAHEAGKPRSFRYRVIAVILGAFLFLVAAPALLFKGSLAVEKYVLTEWWEVLKGAVAYVSVVLGLLVVAWSVLVFWWAGKGTPVPIAPPARLVVTGPYKYCRNPMKLGVLLYYLGIGIYFGSAAIGALMLVLGFVIGGCYHKFIEERELRARFGSEYEEYRKRTPFIIPKFWGD